MSQRIVEHVLPRPHIVVDEYLTTEDLKSVRQGIVAAERHLTVGMMKSPDGTFIVSPEKRNRVVFVDDKAPAVLRVILQVVRASLAAEDFLIPVESAFNTHYAVLRHAHYPSLQLSAYGGHDHYDFHIDRGNNSQLTLVLFLSLRAKAFSGGSLILAHGSRKRTIRFRDNRLVIFPSSTLHKVTPVRTSADAYWARRFSLQMWPILTGPTVGHNNSIRKLAMADAARHPSAPTFGVPIAETRGCARIFSNLTSSCTLAADEPAAPRAFRVIQALTQQLRYLATNVSPEQACYPQVASCENQIGSWEVFFDFFSNNNTQLRAGYRVVSQKNSKSLGLQLFVQTLSTDNVTYQCDLDWSATALDTSRRLNGLLEQIAD
jgi:hypothetical protein